MPFSPLTASQTLTFEIDHLTASTGISDANIGAITRTFLESIAYQIDEAYFQLVQVINCFYISTASGSDLDRRGTDFGLQRNLPLQATVGVVLTGTPGTPVAAGLIVYKAASGSVAEQDFITTAAGIVGSSIPAICTTAGSLGNVGAATITGIQNNPNPALITGVSNPSAAAGGQDLEQDSTYRARLQAYFVSQSKGTVNAIESACLNIPNVGITQAKVYESASLTYNGGGTQQTQDLNTTVKATANFSNPGNLVVVVDNGSGGLSFSAVLAAAQTVNGSPSDPVDYPGFRAAGIQAFITRPSITSTGITLGIYVDPSYNSASVVLAVQQALLTFVSQISIGGSLYLSDIIGVAMSVPGVLDAPFADLTVPSGTVSAPQAGRIVVTLPIIVNLESS